MQSPRHAAASCTRRRPFLRPRSARFRTNQAPAAVLGTMDNHQRILGGCQTAGRRRASCVPSRVDTRQDSQPQVFLELQLLELPSTATPGAKFLIGRVGVSSADGGLGGFGSFAHAHLPSPARNPEFIAESAPLPDDCNPELVDSNTPPRAPCGSDGRRGDRARALPSVV